MGYYSKGPIEAMVPSEQFYERLCNSGLLSLGRSELRRAAEIAVARCFPQWADPALLYCGIAITPLRVLEAVDALSVEENGYPRLAAEAARWWAIAELNSHLNGGNYQSADFVSRMFARAIALAIASNPQSQVSTWTERDAGEMLALFRYYAAM